MEVFKNRLIMIKEENYKYNQKLNCSQNTIDFIRNIIQLQNEPEEVLYLLGLDSKNNIIGFLEIGRGTIDSIQTTPREIFKRALIMNCNKIILTHNHPSGDPTPSKCDYKMTENVKYISEILGIQLLDHIIIGDNENYSIIVNRKV